MTCPFEFYACKGFNDLCVSCAESEKARQKAITETAMAARMARARKLTRAALQAQETRHREVATNEPQEARV